MFLLRRNCVFNIESPPARQRIADIDHNLPAGFSERQQCHPTCNGWRPITLNADLSELLVHFVDANKNYHR